MSRSLLPGYQIYQGTVSFKDFADRVVNAQVFAIAMTIELAIDMMRAKCRSLNGYSELRDVELCHSQDLTDHPFLESVLGLENTMRRG